MEFSPEIEKKTDEELVRLTLENPDMYYHLMKRYEEKMARYIRRISGVSQEDCEDILQEVFLRAYKNLNDFDPQLKFSSWLYRIAHNQTISFWRRTNVRPKTVTTEDDELLNLLKSEDDLEENLLRKIDAQEVQKVFAEMDHKYREALVLRFIEDKSYQEISDILEKPVGTVGTLISRAKDRFKELTGNNALAK